MRIMFEEGNLMLDFLSHGKYTGAVEAAMAKMGRPKSENAKKKTLSIRVEDALYERICNYAEQHQLTVTEVVLQGLDKVLSDLE